MQKQGHFRKFLVDLSDVGLMTTDNMTFYSDGRI